MPLQGFLNAIVYGWTREDFLFVMAAAGTSSKGYHKTNSDGSQSNNFQENSLLTDSDSSTDHEIMSTHTPLAGKF